MKRKLTDTELQEWGERLSNDQSWNDVSVPMVYRMMVDTAGDDYDAGDTDWDFDESDAERLLDQQSNQ